jgi:predicted ATPase
MIIDRISIKPSDNQTYPYDIPLFQHEIGLQVNRPVTIIIGDNGSGKSSLLKIIQSKLKLIEISYPEKQKPLNIDSSLVSLKPSLGKIKGFFFESLSFINYMDYIQKEINDAKNQVERVEIEYKDKSDYAKLMAKSPYAKTISELQGMYSKDLSKSSHGEAYLDFFASRIKDHQLYLLDEPETPLSIQNQLTLMAMIIEAIKRGCQFILATHSPILTAIPNAYIYEIKENQLVNTQYEDIGSIQLLKQFLNQKEQFIRHFTKEEQ